MSESAEERAKRLVPGCLSCIGMVEALASCSCERIRDGIAAEIRAAESAARATAIADSISAVESRLRAEEKALEDKHKLHGRPVVHERQEYMPYIRTSADIAHVRILAVAAIQELANE